MRASLALLALAALARADDPASSWLSYARYDAGAGAKITALNTTWTVPDKPATPFGSNAPGWWFGVMDKDGNGALVQPILAYGYQGSVYSIFNACFDWTDGSWHTSDETYTVQPGDKITSSVTYNADANSYTMLITSEQLGKTIKMDYAIEKRQTESESSAVFVLEHQPRTCRAYPTDGEMSFDNIYVEVDGKAVAAPAWEAKQEDPACNSQATVVDSKTVKFTWSPTADAPTRGLSATAPQKWGNGTEFEAQDKSCTPDANCDGTGGFNCKQCGDSSLPAWSCKSGACCDGHTETSYAGGVICK